MPPSPPFPGLLRRQGGDDVNMDTGPGRVDLLRGRFENPARDSRHGAAERGRFRQRSRDRGNSAPPRGLQFHPGEIRAIPAGVQETIDWMTALESFENRMATVERQLRLQAQSLATMGEQAGRHRDVTKTCNQDISNYKEYVQSIFQHIDSHFTLKSTFSGRPWMAQ